MLRHFVRVSPVVEFFIGRKDVVELAGRDTEPFRTTQVTEVDLAERLAALVADTARQVDAEEHFVRVVDAVDSVHREEVALAFREHQ